MINVNPFIQKNTAAYGHQGLETKFYQKKMANWKTVLVYDLKLIKESQE